MKKSLVLTLLAIGVVASFALGCKKEENVNTDTAAVDTGVTSTGAATMTDTMGTVSTTDTTATTTTATGTTMTSTTSTTGTTGTTKTY
jgi:hypothetical protein